MLDQESTTIPTSTTLSFEHVETNDAVKINGHKKTADDLINRPKVLMYHRIVDDKALTRTQDTCVHIDEFHKQLELMDKMGFTPITFNDYRLYQSGDIRLPRKPIIITFDDGYLDTYRLAFPLLNEYGMKAVVFVMGDKTMKTNEWDAGRSGISEAPLMSNEHIIELHNSGFEIGGHTLSHSNLVKLSEEKCLYEIKKTKKVLEAITGSRIYSFSYPFGQVNQKVKNCVARSGYQYACSVFSGPPKFGSDPFEIRRITVKNKTNIVGFALRLVGPFEYAEWMWWKYRKSEA